MPEVRTDKFGAADGHAEAQAMTEAEADATGGATVNANMILLGATSVGDANWIKQGGTVTVTPTFATDPSGSSNAARLQIGTGGAELLYQVGGTGMAPSTQYTLSFYAKNNGSGAACHYKIRDRDAGFDLVATTSYFPSINSSTWTRISVTCTTAASATSPTPSLEIYLLTEDSTVTDVLLWGAKVEAGAVATGTPSNLG